MLLIAALVTLLEASTKLITAIMEGQTPAVRAELWERHLEETKWIHLLLARASDAIIAGLKLEAPHP